jgi:hypothetical protein
MAGEEANQPERNCSARSQRAVSRFTRHIFFGRRRQECRRGTHKVLYPLTAFLFAGSLFAANPFAGTWKLNVAKSKFEGPIKPPKEQTIFIQEQGDQVAETVKGVAADGSPIFERHTHAATGGELKILEGTPPAGISRVVANHYGFSTCTRSFSFSPQTNSRTSLSGIKFNPALKPKGRE